MRLRAIGLALAIVAGAAALPAQDGTTLRVGILHWNGTIILVGTRDERGWRYGWGGQDPGQKIKSGAEMARIPRSWWGAGAAPTGPWRALFADGRETMLRVSGARSGNLSANEHWMPKTNHVPRPDDEWDFELALVTNPPVPACRLAAVPFDSHDRIAVEQSLSKSFIPLERFEAEKALLSAPEWSRSTVQDVVLPVVWGAAEKSPPPIVIGRLLRSRCMVAGRHVYFVTATRCYPRPGGRRDERVTMSVFQGWLAAVEGEVPVWLRRNVQIGDDGVIERSVDPIGVLEHEGKAYAVAQDAGHAESEYVVYELLSDSMRRVHAAFVAGC